MKIIYLIMLILVSTLTFSGTGCPFMACTQSTCNCSYNGSGECNHNNDNCSEDYEVGIGCIETSCYDYCCKD